MGVFILMGFGGFGACVVLYLALLTAFSYGRLRGRLLAMCELVVVNGVGAGLGEFVGGCGCLILRLYLWFCIVGFSG